MFSAICYSDSDNIIYEERNVLQYDELIENLIDNEILCVALDNLYITEESGCRRVVIYEHEFEDDVLEDTMEYETFLFL